MASSGSSAEAKFSLNLESNAGEVSEDTARQLEELRSKIGASNDTIRQMGSALRSLRGSTDQVKQAKAELTAKISAERDAVSADNLKLLQQGVTYEKLAGQARKLAKEKADLDTKTKSDALAKAKANTDAMSNAVKLAGGPVESLTGSLGELAEVVGGAGAATGGTALVVAGAIAIFAAFTVGVVAAYGALVKFIAVNADANRSLQLAREGAAGSAQNAANLGTQVDLLASKVPASRDEINKLGVALVRTRLSGPAIVDTMNLVGQASSAMGDDVGKSFQDIVTRGAMFNKFRLNPLELQGSGVQFNDVASQLAKNLNIGVAKAKLALTQGQVPLDAGAKALRQVVEKNFGQINLDKMKALTNASETFEKRLAGLTEDVHIDGLLDGIDDLSKLFDKSTSSGAGLKAIVTFVGNEIGPAFKAAVPVVTDFFDHLVNLGLRAAIGFLRLRNQFDETFGTGSAARVGVAALTAGFDTLMFPVKAVGLFVGGIALEMQTLLGYIDALHGAGRAISEGVASGITSGESAVGKATSSLAAKIKDTFTNDLQIHSPSRVTQGYGRDTTEGYAIGVESGAPRALGAFDAIVPDADDLQPGGSSMRGGSPTPQVAGGGSPARVEVHVHVGAGADGEKAAKAITSSSFVAQITKVIEDALHGAGVPTQTVPT